MVFGLATFMGASAQDSWQSIPKGDLYGMANDAHVYDGKLYVATDKGIFACPLQEGQKAWENAGLRGNDIVNFAKYGERLLAVCQTITVNPNGSKTRSYSLLASDDNGATSTDVTPEDIIDDGYFGIHIRQMDSKKPEHLYLTYCNSLGGKPCIMLETLDAGQSWTKTAARDWYGAYTGSFAADPSDSRHILVFGMHPYNDCYCPYVLETKDGFQTLEYLAFEPSRNFMFGDIAFSPVNNALMLAATSEGLAKSDDSGANWQITCSGRAGDTDPWGAYQYSPLGFHSVWFDPSQPTVAYAVFCGHTDGHYNVDIYRSCDAGDSWQIVATSPMQSSSLAAVIHNGAQLILVPFTDDIFCLDLNLLSASISSLSTTATSQSDVFTLLGTKAKGKSTSGIYIKNGHKRVVK